jgi:5-bromo-4-chloroindolyl phosphate hydrolysis protein
VKWYGKYGRKASQIMRRFWKYSRKLWKYMKNMENMEEKYFFLAKQLKLPVIYWSLQYALHEGGITLYMKGCICNGGHNSLCEE